MLDGTIGTDRETPSSDPGAAEGRIVARVARAVRQLRQRVAEQAYAGYDPFDGLESPVFKYSPLRRLRWGRILWQQGVKRSLVNLRPLLLVPKGRNPKAIALSVSALVDLSEALQEPQCASEGRDLLRWLEGTARTEPTGMGWGYNFAWQSRVFYAPKDLPNAVCTVFVAHAFLDAFEHFGEAHYAEVARACGRFILSEMIATEGDQTYVRYIAGANARVHNVSLLTGGLLARLHRLYQESELHDVARRVVRGAIMHQRPDGAWPYGAGGDLSWIDNLHTGYNLVALARYRRYSGDLTCGDALERGYRFWVDQFFLPDGTPKYYHDRVYPLDTHTVAQAILTHIEVGGSQRDAVAKAMHLARWSLDNLRTSDGRFVYQRGRWFVIRVEYLRWTLAWMFHALSRLLATGMRLGLWPRVRQGE